MSAFILEVFVARLKQDSIKTICFKGCVGCAAAC